MDDQGVESFATGLSNSISSYLGGQLNAQNAIEQKQQESDIEANKEIKVAKAQNDISNPPGSGNQFIPMDPQMAEKALPGYGAKMVQEYNQRNPQSPLTLNQASDYIGKAKALLDTSDPKADSNQDKLEKQAMDRLTTVRGDQSLMRAEHQRDSAGMAYDTIVKAQSENRPLTELEQTDLIGQLWQARTGKAPTDSDMKLLNDKTAKRGFNHMVTYLTGDPSLVAASTDATLANLKQFVTATGSKADQQWDAYMKPRLIKPTGLQQDRWDHIVSQHRGITFADQQKTSDTTYQAKQVKVTPASVRAKLGI